jgi:hypothetical protein
MFGAHKDGLDRPETHTAGSSDDADGTDAIFSTVLTVIFVVPFRPSRAKEISIPSVRRKVCARRRRPASAPK